MDDDVASLHFILKASKPWPSLYDLQAMLWVSFDISFRVWETFHSGISTYGGGMGRRDAFIDGNAPA